MLTNLFCGNVEDIVNLALMTLREHIDRLSTRLIPPENIPRVNLLHHVIETGVIAVRNDGVAL